MKSKPKPIADDFGLRINRGIGEEEVEIDVSRIMKYSVASCEEACSCAIFESHDEDTLDFSYDELIEKQRTET